MLWSKNKEGKKAGTTLIGISFDGKAALGTDFDASKCDGDSICMIEDYGGFLLGYSGPDAYADALAIAKSAIERGDTIDMTADAISNAWNVTDNKIDAYLTLLDGEKSFVVIPGEAEQQHAGLVAVGPGEEYALAAIRAILAQPVVQEDAYTMVKKAFDVAAGVCVLVNSGAKIIEIDNRESNDDE
ncbi:MAG TPA: hypothetical protein ENN07_00085 [candidate division Zixibacteria bacterium]|nr:hypothetical protein [candidate division Zixibacteria bacterium]